MLKYHKSTPEEEKEFYEEMEKYPEPTEEEIERYNKEWLEDVKRIAKLKKKDSE